MMILRHIFYLGELFFYYESKIIILIVIYLLFRHDRLMSHLYVI